MRQTEGVRRAEVMRRTEGFGKLVDKRQVWCIVLGIMAAAAGYFVENSSGALEGGNRLPRNSYGGGDLTREIVVEGLFEEVDDSGGAVLSAGAFREPGKETITVTVGERQYGRPEAEKAMEEAVSRLAEVIPGENPSLGEVRGALVFPVWLDEYGISAAWQPEDPELIAPDGEVLNGGCPEAGTKTSVTVCLRAGEYAGEYTFPVTVFPPGLSGREARTEAFLRELGGLDKEQQTGEQLILPEEYGGRPLRYREKRSRDFLLFPFLGLLAACLLPLRDRQREKEAKQKREWQMMLDYPGIVSKLVVFSGAGLPVRKAWERIVAEYEEKRGEEHAAYEEMAAAYHMMQRGVPELRAYAEFGSRCRLIPYRKLAGLLEQNIKNGSEGLRAALESEMENAFEQQKTLARRMGEEASTKLLLPLFMLLFIVMVMISVPAFLSFGIG